MTKNGKDGCIPLCRSGYNLHCMNTVIVTIENIFKMLYSVNFALVALIDLGCFAAVCILSLFGVLISKRLRAAEKRPFFHLVNAFAALTLALFCLEFDFSEAVIISAALWFVGYLIYGVLCAVTPKHPKRGEERTTLRVQEVNRPYPTAFATPNVPPAQNTVRLEHALSIADKLLVKNLGRGDRQELEKMKTALTVLKVKGVLSPEEGEALNEMFNALLKLMAKYDL